MIQALFYSLVLFVFSSLSLASVQLSTSEPLIMDLKRSYLIDANTVLEFTPPTLKMGLNISNPSESKDLIIEKIEVTINYKHKDKILKHKTNVNSKNIININSNNVYIDLYSLDANSILKLEPKQSIRLGGDSGWVILENLIPKEELGYGGYMDVSFLESEIQFIGSFLDKTNGKKNAYIEKIKFNPRRN